MVKMSSLIAAVMMLVCTSVASLAEEGPTPDDVAFVQGLLVRFGYDPGPIDGICGDQTAAAVRSFHSDRDLPLGSGDIEPQAATVVGNLTAAYEAQVKAPAPNVAGIYLAAITGDATAALQLGTMYEMGENVGQDHMSAYFWWTVAEAGGSEQAIGLKRALMASAQITPHEAGYATTLAERIATETCSSGDCEPIAKDDATATM
jgi:hypothetical protein